MTLVCLLVGTICFVPALAGIVSDIWRHGGGRGAPSVGSLAPISSSDCSFARALSTWSVEKQRWCCDKRRIGCKAYECGANATLESLWPEEQRTWCCRHAGRGCEPTSSTAPDATTQATSSTTLEPHRVKVSLQSQESAEKLQGPRRKELVQRVEPGQDHLQEPRDIPHSKAGAVTSRTTTPRPATSSTTSRAPLPSSAPATARNTRFDCNEGYDAGGTAWSPAKRFWCCEFGSRCPGVSLPVL
eukprot:CAMPEP_0197900794 /NCGR_PEP_ID=MMETSP1439-20131203/49944_1 /TAXON_ID=66791 /ORGANISM="Gonyaulax spinifera, Strain CCMP409" /LENGTH=243 /DNA_ID=CAMNT_0043521721 /DNA_START=493 /DNA_END=1224 /DNA_ORIENTATION=-